MKRRLVFLPGAESDLAAAVEFYDHKRAGLGRDLLTAVERALATIEDAPSAQPLFAPGSEEKSPAPLRKYMLARFPCIIVFREQEAEIAVLAVVHGRRGPALRSGVIDAPMR